ncbi:uncharacterized protein LOC117500287 isoform X2 [Trematomus bernacchii]|uniref:uncharacterized protein LOC117500287 isoform X2 n=1 Tax=Trematomus bernacchii TaxID=40690 RepID=UPI00146F9279|nr:uncharacterized protein LOC117500287 isoform X2 [Trematomus bernacchii]
MVDAAEISTGTLVFVRKGKDVDLNVTNADALQDVFSSSWKKNGNKIVLIVNSVKHLIVFPDYAERIELAVNNVSVKLKNLQEADSGVYTAVVTKLSGDVTEAAKYKITVQDRASLPLLTVDSVSSNSSSCSFTVTCSSQDSHINSTFTCDNQTCRQEGGEQSEVIPDTFLQVHQSSGSIICNHSNHVSWTNDTKTINDVCHVPPQPDPVPIILGVCIPILILAIIGAVHWCLRTRRTSKGVIDENTVYDTAQFVAPARTQDPTDDEDSALCPLTPAKVNCTLNSDYLSLSRSRGAPALDSSVHTNN